MAPNLFDQTTLNTSRVSYKTVSTTGSNWNITPTNYTGTYDSWGDNYTITIIDRPSKEEIKKRLKKMMDRWCIDSWTHYVSYRPMPKLQPINLRGVRLDGRGWANL